LSETRRIALMAAISWQGGIEAEEGHV